MHWYIWLIIGLFAFIMLLVALAYAYFIIAKLHRALDKYKSKDWRYDG